MNDCGMRMRATCWVWEPLHPATNSQSWVQSALEKDLNPPPEQDMSPSSLFENVQLTLIHTVFLWHMRKSLPEHFQRVRWLSNWNLFPAVPEKQREGLGSFSSKQQGFEDPSSWHLALPWVRGLTQSFVSHALVLHVGAGLNGPFESLPTQNILCLPCLCVISGHGVEACPDSDARDSFRKPSQWEAITSLLPLLPCAITRLLLPLQQNQHDVPEHFLGQGGCL